MFNGNVVQEAPPNTWGFLYVVSWDGKYYIGQKSFWSVRNLKLSKKRSSELYSGRGAKPKKERVQKESDWRTYKTSSKEVQELVKQYGESYFTWQILDFASTKSELNYKETQYILCNDCLRDQNCLNYWISCKIYRTHL